MIYLKEYILHSLLDCGKLPTVSTVQIYSLAKLVITSQTNFAVSATVVATCNAFYNCRE